jgi:hypothetical protein
MKKLSFETEVCPSKNGAFLSGLPDFPWYKVYQNGGKKYQMTAKLPNAHKIYTMVVIYSK